MRAWTNMGISQANVGQYDASARYYVRALGLNPRWAAAAAALVLPHILIITRMVEVAVWNRCFCVSASVRS